MCCFCKAATSLRYSVAFLNFFQEGCASSHLLMAMSIGDKAKMCKLVHSECLKMVTSFQRGREIEGCSANVGS